MATTVYQDRARNVTKTWFLMLTFLIMVIGLGWAVSWYFNSPAILYVAVIFAVVMNIASFWFSDRIVLRLAGAQEISRESHFTLWNTVENLSITAGLPMPDVYIIGDSIPNAFATGRDQKHAVVAVTTGLVDMLSETELQGVIAHELAHIQNRDILLQTVVVILVGFVALLSDFFLRLTIFGGGGDRGEGRAQLLFVLLGIALAILSPIIATVIKLAISRKREFLADATGALITRYPEGLASALEKISNYSSGKEMKRANHATAHLYFASPFGQHERVKGFMNRLFATHPPISDRLAALRSSGF